MSSGLLDSGRKWDILIEDGKGLDVTLGVSPAPPSRLPLF